MRTFRKLINNLSNKHKLLFVFISISSLIVFFIDFLSLASIPVILNFILNKEYFIDFIDNLNIDFFDSSIISLISYQYFIFGIIFLFFLKNIYILFHSYIENLFIYKVSLYFQSKLFQKYIDNEYYFHVTNSPSLLLRNINEVKRVCSLIKTIQISIRESLIVASLIAILLALTFKTTILSIILLIFFTYIFIKFFQKISSNKGFEFQYAEKNKIKYFNEALGSIKELKINNIEKLSFNLFFNSVKQSDFIIFILNIIASLPKIFFEILAIISLSIYLYSFTNLSNSNESLLVFIFFATSLARLLPSFIALSSNLNFLSFYSSAMSLIDKDLKPSSDKKENKINYIDEFKSMSLKNVYFSYNQRPFLKNLNFSINKGEKILIKGTSGSGKTTLVDIISGLLKPLKGKYLINKKIKNKYSIKFGYLTQDIFVFDDSLINNITLNLNRNLNTYDKSEIDRVYELINIFNLKTIINNKSDLSINLGDRGKKLSGGQIQRIGIARVLYRNPDIIILDEATNALDKENELLVIKKLLSKKDLTLIFITHKDKFDKKFLKKFYIYNGLLKKVKF